MTVQIGQPGVLEDDSRHSVVFAIGQAVRILDAVRPRRFAGQIGTVVAAHGDDDVPPSGGEAIVGLT